MFNFRFTGRNIFILGTLLFLISSAFFSHYLSGKLAATEKQKVEIWANAQKFLSTANAGDQNGLDLAILISTSNTDIPIIETNEKDIPSGMTRNLDSVRLKKDPQYLNKELAKFRHENEPIIVKLSGNSILENRYYYGSSSLQITLQYFPLIQFVIVGLFCIMFLIIQKTKTKNEQNLLWIGMAKETAHQLGTPLSSLEGWLEILKLHAENETYIPEIKRDLERLQLVSDRFGKIGSSPKLELKDINLQIDNMVNYIRKRAAGKIAIHFSCKPDTILASISPPLFDWVIENLLKNALDAMDGKGNIEVQSFLQNHHIIIEVKDSGKGIAPANIGKVFLPGFTTKKRGWGFGLALTKRIIEEYHHGKIIVKDSEVGRGTTFRIQLPIS
ncbi:sensor histidine kinase [Rhizosphaericola mali]|uniref:histidine kinase n=1 Tax=Rhizosphaericola mali TaxID=2545455 RepID=A0A5P2GEY2_9BACT|nr:ATP-binding protein [Rhizosphaericola mali]QES90161.1 sensor histidine kinase [Rhizosphaericola mali]